MKTIHRTLLLSELKVSVKRPPYGITGFHYYLDEPPPVTDEKAFLSLCHTFSRQIDSEIIDTQRIHRSRENNFTSVTFQTRSETFSTLLNGHYPVIAFSVPVKRNVLEVEFLDRTSYANHWKEISEYQVLTLDELSLSVYEMDFTDISDSEYDQILIHKPPNSGQIIFNYWD